MTTNTTFLNMKLYNSTTDGSATFATFRADIDGVSPTSNFNLLDTFAQNISASVISLQGKAVYLVPALFVSTGYYEANSVSSITSLTTNMYIDLYLDTTNDGTTGLNINSLGTKTLKKVDASGNLVDLIAGDLIKNHENIFRYNGTYFIWIAASGGGGVSAITGSSVMSDTSGSVVKHNSSGATPGSYLSANVTVDVFGHITSITNGASASSTGAPADNPFYVSGSVDGITNAKFLTSGSNTTFEVSGSTVRIHSASALQAIAGSGIMSNSSGSVVKHSTSGVVSGSYNRIQTDTYGHIVAGSVIAIPVSASLVPSTVLQTYDSDTGLFSRANIPTTENSVAGMFLSGYSAVTGSFVSSSALQTITGSGVMSSTSGSTVIHNNSTATPGSYTSANITIDQQGHVTAAANGTGGAVVSGVDVLMWMGF